MSEFTVKTGTSEEEKSVSFSYAIPESLSGLVAAYGDGVVFEFAARAVAQAVQNVARVGLKEGASAEAIQKTIDAYVPGVRSAAKRKSDLSRAESLLANLTPDELSLLQAKVAAAKKAASRTA